MAASANASTRSNARWLGLETTCVKAHRVSPSFLNVPPFATLREGRWLGSVVSADPHELHLPSGRRYAALDAAVSGYAKRRHNLVRVQDDNLSSGYCRSSRSSHSQARS
jgi:hypothetical protein